jgi:ribulose-5-phosphate 4-epimerase/fuculose-1-phosphate aldolase
MSFEEVKEQVAIANRILAELGLSSGVRASLGHSSMRVPEAPDRFFVKGRGYDLDALATMRPDDMVLCDLEGFRIDGPKGVNQCQEVKIHSCIYRTYPDVRSIVHVHPTYVILMSVVEEPLRPMCQEGIQLVRRPLPVYPHVKTIQSEEEGMEVATLLSDYPAVLLRGHGAVTIGNSLAQSVMSMYQLEEQARMNYFACNIAGLGHKFLPDEYIDEMTNRTPMEELPHFKGLERNQGRYGGALGWSYFVDLVKKNL